MIQEFDFSDRKLVDVYFKNLNDSKFVANLFLELDTLKKEKHKKEFVKNVYEDKRFSSSISQNKILKKLAEIYFQSGEFENYLEIVTYSIKYFSSKKNSNRLYEWVQELSNNKRKLSREINEQIINTITSQKNFEKWNELIFHIISESSYLITKPVHSEDVNHELLRRAFEDLNKFQDYKSKKHFLLCVHNYLLEKKLVHLTSVYLANYALNNDHYVIAQSLITLFGNELDIYKSAKQTITELDEVILKLEKIEENEKTHASLDFGSDLLQTSEIGEETKINRNNEFLKLNESDEKIETNNEKTSINDATSIVKRNLHYEVKDDRDIHLGFDEILSSNEKLDILKNLIMSESYFSANRYVQKYKLEILENESEESKLEILYLEILIDKNLGRKSEALIKLNSLIEMTKDLERKQILMELKRSI